jgi:hypothetical protein
MQEKALQEQAAAAKKAKYDADVAAAIAEFAAAAPPAGPGMRAFTLNTTLIFCIEQCANSGTVNIAVKLPSGKRPTRRYSACVCLLMWVLMCVCNL